MNRSTKDLRNLVQRQAGEDNSAGRAQHYLNDGADITVGINGESMIDVVINEADRRRLAMDIRRADNCLRLSQVLQRESSRLLAKRVLTSNGTDIDQIRDLIRLRANTYQSEVYGALGLLGNYLKQEEVSVRLEIVQILIECDRNTYAGLTAENEENETCLSIARGNPKCSREVIEYLQHQFDTILNRVPFLQSPIDTNEVIKWIHRGANTEVVDERGNTVLSNAVLTNNLDLARALVSCGCNTSHTNAERLTPLGIAKKATPRNPLLIAALEVDNFNRDLQRLIETKKSRLTVEEVSALLSQGADIKAPIPNHGSFLHLLIANEGTPAMIITFVNEFHADLAIMDSRGHRAVEKCILIDENPYLALSALLNLSKETASMFFNGKLNKTLLQFAADHKRTDAGEIIQHSINERLWLCISESSVTDATVGNLMTEVEELIHCGAQINCKHTDQNHREWTVLHLACQKANKVFVQFLIEKVKADYLMRNGFDDLPIAIATESGNLPVLEYLWALPRSNINVCNRDKETPLHLATKNQHLSVVRFLVRWGIDSGVKDRENRTALDIARAILSQNGQNQINTQLLVSFLEQLSPPMLQRTREQSETTPKKPDIDLDVCQMVASVCIEPIKTGNGDPSGRGNRKLGFLEGTPNDHLHEAAGNGLLDGVKKAVGQGANICYRKNGFTAYQVVAHKYHELRSKLPSTNIMNSDYQRIMTQMHWYQKTAETLSEMATKKLIEAIDASDSSLVAAYHIAGATLTADLLYRVCSNSDNVEITHYLIEQSKEIFQSMYKYDRPKSPYQTASENNFRRVASYLKYTLSMECKAAVEKNNLPHVRELVFGGASVDMLDTNNLQEALKHNNIELIQFLLDHGAKMPKEWMESPNIILSKDAAQTMPENIVAFINKCLINRRLRLAAADGDLDGVIRCQRFGADINSKNCYGSTAGLCAIQHGNYFSIVHALVSCGASILHSNCAEPMSLSDLARRKQYIDIANYLDNELNAQFITAIINDDQKSAQIFQDLGVDFNYQDREKRTALHYAVEHHSIDLVTWLCDRGCLPMSADSHGDYPITLATKKGTCPVKEDEIDWEVR